MNTSPSTNTGRLQSLDLMRGLIMVLLAFEAAELYTHLLNITTPGTWGHSLMRQFFHNDWEGLHFWDLVQPAFMLMAGVAMAYSLTAQTRKGVPWNCRLRKILRRCAWLLFWGIVKRIAFPDWLHLQSLDVTDILTQLAFTTLIAFLLFRLSARRLLLACAAILALTETLYRSFHIPGEIEGYTMGMNAGSYIDHLLLGQTGNKYVFINWLPTAVHTLLGVVLGKWLLQGRQVLTRMTLTAAVCLTTGYALSLSGLTPVIKPIATTSFVLQSAGYVILLLAALHYMIDRRGVKRGIFFFRVVGMNSIFIYLFFDIVGRGWFNAYVSQLLSPLQYLFQGTESLYPPAASLAVFAAEWGICFFLYRKNIFFKL
ncbi:MAG: hypothetical protein PUG76_01470 [Prevotellaceae bacterium]|nr:hypothetical protein [Prevotellaceae bacterium]